MRSSGTRGWLPSTTYSLDGDRSDLDLYLSLVHEYDAQRMLDGDVLTSDSTLRFRERPEVERDLAAAGYVLEDVRDAPDRPGRELVFVARRPA